MKEIAFFQYLLDRGLSYLYEADDWKKINKQGNRLFPSPILTKTINKVEIVEELIQPTLEPIFLTANEVDELGKLAAAWYKLMKVQWQIFCQGKKDISNGKKSVAAKIARLVCTEEELRLGENDPDYDLVTPFIRFDCQRTSEGFKIIDINSTRPAGVGDLIVLHSGYYQFFPQYFEHFQAFNIGQAFTQVVKKFYSNWQEIFRQRKPARILMLSNRFPGDWPNFDNLACEFLTEDWVADINISEQPVTNLEPNLLIRNRIKANHQLFPYLANGYPRKACVLSPLFRRWIGNKLWLAFLQILPYKNLIMDRLGSDDQMIIKKSLLPTGIICGQKLLLFNEQLPLQMLEQKEWIIKSPASSSGKGLYFGRDMSKKHWQQLLQEIPNYSIAQKDARVKENFLVVGQDGQPIKTQLYSKYGVFIYGGQLSGIEVYARQSPLVHGAHDAYLTTCLKPK